MMHYSKDDMLTEYKDTIRTLKSKNYLTLSNNTLNLYSALVKKEDITHAERLKRIPYAKHIKKYLFSNIHKLPKRYIKNNYYILRKELALYFGMRKRPIRPKVFNRWIKHDIFPLPFIRIVSRVYGRENNKGELFVMADLFSKLKYVTDINDQARFKPILNLKNLLTPFNFYLVGCTFGDGYINKKEWRLSDGNPNKSLLKYSKNYLIRLSKLLKKHFEVSFILLETDRNMYNLLIPNKWFALFLHYFFDISFGKANIKLPSLLTKKFNKFLLRGIFDSEGSVGNVINFIMKDKQFVLWCKKTLSGLHIHSQLKYENSGYRIQIGRTYFPEFAANIGFAHPLKQLRFKENLKKGIKKTKFIGVDKTKLVENNFDITQIKDLRVYGLSDFICQLRKGKNLSQKKLAELAHVNEWNIRYWEKGSGIKILDLCKITNAFDLDFVSLLKSNNILYSVGDIKISNKIQLPIKIDKDIIKIAENIRPGIRAAQIRKENELRRLREEELSELKQLIKSVFNVDTKYNLVNLNIYVESQVFNRFFNTFFIYKVPWVSYSDDQISNLIDSWNFN